MSSTRCASSDRPATSASRGSVQSISTTWTPTSSALAGRASSDASATIDRSVRPPDSATTARRNWGADVSATGYGSSAFSTTPDERLGHASGGSSRRVTIPPAVTRPASARRHPRPASGLVVVAAPVGDVRDDRVLPADELRLEPLRRLVVEQPVPPALGDVLGEDDDRRGRLLVRRPGDVEDVEVRHDRADERAERRRHDDERDARQLAGPAHAERVGLLEVGGHEDGLEERRVAREALAEHDRLDHRAVDAVDRDHDPLLAVRPLE